jgi:hypothetical protein
MGTWVPDLPSGGDSYRFGGDVKSKDTSKNKKETQSGKLQMND